MNTALISVLVELAVNLFKMWLNDSKAFVILVHLKDFWEFFYRIKTWKFIKIMLLNIEWIQ